MLSPFFLLSWVRTLFTGKRAGVSDFPSFPSVSRSSHGKEGDIYFIKIPHNGLRKELPTRPFSLPDDRVRPLQEGFLADDSRYPDRTFPFPFKEGNLHALRAGSSFRLQRFPSVTLRWSLSDRGNLPGCEAFPPAEVFLFNHIKRTSPACKCTDAS